jgi:copper oxidase (laccase) domain-containing protein
MRVSSPEITHIIEPHAEIVYTGIAFGNVDFRFGAEEDVLANQKRLEQTLMPEHYIMQKVKLKPEFLDLSDIPTEELDNVYETDGLFIDRPRVALGLNPADCNAITMYDAVAGRAMGLIHAGRPGMDGGIHIAALDHLTGKYAIPLADVRLHFAPSVRKESYFFPSINAEQLIDPKYQRYIELRQGNYYIDLVGRIVDEMVEHGVNPDQFVISPVDVGSDPGYYSHIRYNRDRDNETIGRNGVITMLRIAS